MHSFQWKLLVVAVISFTGATQAEASLIPGVSVSTDMGAFFGTDINNVVNGVGLSGDVAHLFADHASTDIDNSWIAAVSSGQLTFDLGGTFLLDGFSFWNQNDGGPGAMGSSGIDGVTVLFSTNGIDFSPLAGAPSSFAQVTSAGPVGPEVFALTPVLASHVRFQIAGNHGDAFTGFGEVQFSQFVPESAHSLLVFLIGCLLASRRRWPSS